MNPGSKKNKLNNERGNAMIETLPLIIIFVVLLSFGLGFFGIVHTAILNSIGSRAYAFETFSFRSDTKLFRDRKAANNKFTHHTYRGSRFHTINTDKAADFGTDTQYATTRNLAFGRRIPAGNASEADHNTKIYDISGRNRNVEVSPAWIMVGYGLCIDARCGD